MFFVEKAHIVQSPGENSPVPLWIVLIPQVQVEEIPSEVKANKRLKQLSKGIGGVGAME